MHTLGPWEVGQDTGFAYTGPRIRGDGIEIATIHEYTGRDRGEEGRANARLIATAPELLAALKAVNNTVVLDETPRQRRLMRQVRAAIAKAEGK